MDDQSGDDLAMVASADSCLLATVDSIAFLGGNASVEPVVDEIAQAGARGCVLWQSVFMGAEPREELRSFRLRHTPSEKAKYMEESAENLLETGSRNAGSAVCRSIELSGNGAVRAARAARMTLRSGS